ncbi:MAG: hypothetical protein E7158_05210 [Firmicutes bacterium]|nr:hypothetical protein [Bacillota bacterium]
MNFDEFDFTGIDINNILDDSAKPSTKIEDFKFLEKFGYTSQEISDLLETAPTILKEKMLENSKLVCQNLKYLQELGVTNLKDIFNNYYDMFLMDYSNFTGIFQKYDPQDLVEKLEKNIEIIDFL